MMDKPTPLKAVEDATPLSEDRMKKADEAFSRFQAFQVDSKVMVGARQIITTCSVRRPKNNEFVRVSENPELFTGLVYEEKEEEAFYLVKPEALRYFYTPPPMKILVLTVNQNGVFFLWPVPVDDQNTWNKSTRRAYQVAKTDWVKLVGDRKAGEYSTFLAEGDGLPPPRFPDKSYWELLDLAFPNSKIVGDADHEVVLKIRTGTARK
jgi:hypothetical protein